MAEVTRSNAEIEDALIKLRSKIQQVRYLLSTVVVWPPIPMACSPASPYDPPPPPLSRHTQRNANKQEHRVENGDPPMSNRVDDDRFLLAFLHARKFDINRAYTLLFNYFKFMRDHRALVDKAGPEHCAGFIETGAVKLLPTVGTSYHMFMYAYMYMYKLTHKLTTILRAKYR